ncbi:hypothetical protein HDV57DRAFT_415268 [Trichoderma longibrachiatum]
MRATLGYGEPSVRDTRDGVVSTRSGLAGTDSPSLTTVLSCHPRPTSYLPMPRPSGSQGKWEVVVIARQVGSPENGRHVLHLAKTKAQKPIAPPGVRPGKPMCHSLLNPKNKQSTATDPTRYRSTSRGHLTAHGPHSSCTGLRSAWPSLGTAEAMGLPA